MRRTLWSLAGLFTLGLTLGEGLEVHAQQQIQFFASVVDEGGEPVSGLMPEDFRVLESGEEGKVLKVEPIDWPVKVSILVDNGPGLSPDLVPIRNGLKALLAALPEGIEMSLVTMAPQARFVRRPTKDREAILKGIDLIVPDAGAAVFIDALNEVARRIDSEKGNHFPVVIVVGSTAPDGSTSTESRAQRMLNQFRQRAATVHVVMVTTATGRTAGWVNQLSVGMEVAKITGGRYDNITAGSRLATLLPEIGEQVAKSHARQSRQYRITAARPAGATGPPTGFNISTLAGRTLLVTQDGHIP
jgi:hypothetical protein